ncbi:MAG TPA: 3-isopropylmalate dehydratase [Firmicutes bacterium]|nr:3-isopropylmalate dehydratase [Bacillota bacterium]
MIEGKVWTLGRDINTDSIMAGRYCSMQDRNEQVKHVLEDLDPTFAKTFPPGGVIVADENFGCGSSREIAPLILKVAGVAAVVASSFARIFYRNAINIGLPIFEAPSISGHFTQGQLIAIDAETGKITNIITGEYFQVEPLPPFMQKIIKAGGLIAYASKQLEQA